MQMIVLRVGEGLKDPVSEGLALSKKACSDATGLETLFQANQPYSSLTHINHS